MKWKAKWIQMRTPSKTTKRVSKKHPVYYHAKDIVPKKTMKTGRSSEHQKWAFFPADTRIEQKV